MSINVRHLIIGQPLATSQVVHQRLSRAEGAGGVLIGCAVIHRLCDRGDFARVDRCRDGRTGRVDVDCRRHRSVAADRRHVVLPDDSRLSQRRRGLYRQQGKPGRYRRPDRRRRPVDRLHVDSRRECVGRCRRAHIGIYAVLEAYRVPVALVIVVFHHRDEPAGRERERDVLQHPDVYVHHGHFLDARGRVVPGRDRDDAACCTALPGGAGGGLPHTQQHTDNIRDSIFLMFRAFAGGCTALTGVEAISNGIPAFKQPESDNAAKTLLLMVTILVSMFLGITFLANRFDLVAYEGMERTILSQLGQAVFGEGSWLFYYLQFSTLFILSLAANTAYADFPRLASLIAADRYLPRQLTTLGDRLVFSNGIIALAILSSFLIIGFNAREHNLLPLYAVGVFLSFTLSQTGMVIHWLKVRHHEGFKPTNGWRFKIGMNAFGACCTFIVLLILLITKFIEGAWIVAVTIPILMYIFTRIHRHYSEIAESLSIADMEPVTLRPDPNIVNERPIVVLVSGLHRSSVQALEYALSLSRNVRAVTIAISDESTEHLQQKWKEWDIQLPLDVVDSPYRELGRPLVDYLHSIDEKYRFEIPTAVVIPEFVVRRWHERWLHNQTAVAIRFAMYRDQLARGRGRPVITVPYRIGEKLYEPIGVGEGKVAAQLTAQA
jgi:hypothetical protein